MAVLPSPAIGYFAITYFEPGYFESQYFLRVKTLSPYADILEFSLEVNRGKELFLSINKQVDEVLNVNRKLEFTVER